MNSSRFVLAMLLFASPAIAGEPKRDRFGDPLPEGAVARLGTINAHPGAELIVFSANGKTLRTIGAASIRDWDSTSGKVIRTQTLPVDRNAYSQRISANGRVMVRVYENKIVVLDLLPPKERLRVAFDESKTYGLVSISPDGRRAVLAFRELPSNRLHLPIMNLETGDIGEWKEFGGEPLKITFSPDGKLIAAGLETLEDGFQCRESDGGATRARAFPPLLPMAFSPNGKRIAVADRYGKWFEIWDVETGKPAGVPRLKSGRREPIRDPAAAGAFSSDETLFAAWMAGQLQIWDLKTGKAISSWPCTASSMAFSPDGRRLATFNGTVRVWNVAVGKPLTPDYGPLPFHDREDRSFIFSNASNGRIATGPDADRRIRVWDLATGKPTREFEAVGFGLKTLWLSPDKKRLVACADNMAQIWDVNSGKQMRLLPLQPVDEGLVSWEIGSARIVDRGDTMAITLIRTTDGEFPNAGLVRWDLRSNKMLSFHQFVLPGWSEPIALGPSGRAALRLGQCWGIGDARARSLLLSDAGFDFCKPAPEFWFDNRLAVASLHSSAANPTYLAAWEVASARAFVRIPIAGISDPKVAISPDSRWLAFAGAESIELWDLAEGKRAPFHKPHEISRDLRASGDYSLDLAFLPDGKHLIAAHGDGTALVWELPPEALKPPSQRMTSHTWDDLSSFDARVGHNAVWAMWNEPAKALALLKEKLRPATMPPANELAALIEELSAKEFARREEAMKRLRTYGQTIEPTLREAANRTSNAEQKKRLNELLSGYHSVASRTPEEIRAIRCVQVLERWKDPGAKKLLRELAKGEPSAILTQEARKAQ